MMRPSPRQSGSIFFMIFIAIGLFAALSYAIFQGGRVGAASLTKEQSKMAAQEIVAYGDALAQAVQTLRLRGCAETQLDFGNTAWAYVNTSYIHPTGHNAGAPASGCSVFKTDGNLTPVVFPLSYFDTSLTLGAASTNFGASNIRKIVLPNVGTTNSDMHFYLPRIKRDICIEINKSLNVPQNNYLPVHSISGSESNTIYNGGFGIATIFVHNTAGMDGTRSFCSQQSGGPDRYNFYTTLIVR